jgi:RNA polymerase sigma factor (sigma-70 family)
LIILINKCNTNIALSYINIGSPNRIRMQETKQGSTNTEIFAELYDEFMPKVFRYISYKVNNEQLTEDLTSTVFEKALVNFHRYSSNKAAFSTWIFSIARNTIIDYYRTTSKRQHTSLDETFEMPSGEPSPDEEVEKKEEQEWLRRCLVKLPAEDQEIIRLKFAAELNNRQIAKMLGLSESNVGVKLFRVLKRLREDFKESWNG